MAHKNPTNRSPMKPKSPQKVGGGHRKPERIYEFHEADNRIFDIFRNHGFGDLSHPQRHQLVRYYQLLMEEQQRQNFTRLVSLRDVAIKHFIDCLILPRWTNFKFPLLDMGTGPGFPGIPLKILFPQERVLLGEGVQKRVEFLKKVREELKLENLDIVGKNIDQDFHLPVQGVITRAVEDIQNSMRNVLSCLEVGGHLYLMKGPNVDPEIRDARRIWREHYELVEDHSYNLPETTHQRRLLVYKKIKAIDGESGHAGS